MGVTGRFVRTPHRRCDDAPAPATRVAPDRTPATASAAGARHQPTGLRGDGEAAAATPAGPARARGSAGGRRDRRGARGPRIGSGGGLPVPARAERGACVSQSERVPAESGAPMTSPDEIRRRIEAALPGAEVQVADTTGAGDHFEVRVRAAAFGGKTLIEQHQMIYGVLGTLMPENHALALRTAAA